MQNPKPIAIALQGGGSHGAFTWGVLDKLLEDGRLHFEAISGTSAGALNAVALADGFERKNREGARAQLSNLWESISNFSYYSPIRRTWLDYLTGSWNIDCSPGYNFVDFISKFLSPYTFNPLNINPLKDLINDIIDFELIRHGSCPKMFISCTNVETGRARIFKRNSLSAEVVMASAALPLVFQAVEIDGCAYWDGGYMGNPVIFPFHKETETLDYVIVQINPICRKGIPKGVRDILNRVNEISFNANLLQELRAIDFARRLIDQGRVDPRVYKRINLHIISNDKELVPLGASSKFNIERPFLEHLFEVGRQTAQLWLDKNYEKIGVQSSVNIQEMFAADR